MNKNFDTKRLGLFLKREIVRAYSDMGLTILILGLAPAILFGVIQTFALIIAGEMVSFTYTGILAFTMALSLGSIVVPIKLYGPLTDKRFGSEWLMIPASRQEKFTAMMLITCVIAPLSIVAITFVTDGLLSLVFHNQYGQLIATKVNFKDMLDFMRGLACSISGCEDAVDMSELEGIRLHLSMAGTYILNWLEYTMFFLLGAVIFDKSKFGKTLLCLMGLSMVLSMASTALFSFCNLDGLIDALYDANLQQLINYMMVAIYTLYAAVILVPAYFIWRRIKNLKH